VLDYNDALEIKEMLLESEVKLGVIQNYRYFPAIQKMKHAIKAGRIGKIVTMNSIAYTPSPMSWTRGKWLYHFGGAVDDFGPHVFDMLCYLSDATPTNVIVSESKQPNTYPCVTNVNMIIEFDNNISGLVSISWLMGFNEFSVSVHGTGGKISSNVILNKYEEIHGHLTPWRDLVHFTKNNFQILTDVISGKFFKSSAQFYPEIYSSFIECIRTDGKPDVDIDDALKTIKIMNLARDKLKKIYAEDDVNPPIN